MAVALHSQSHLGYGSYTNPTVTAPAGISNGDILLLVAVTYNGSGTAPTPSPPAGFTAAPGSTGGLLVSASPITSGDNMRLFAWTKVAASESGNYSITQAVGSSDYWMGDYTGGNSSTPMASGWTGNSGNSQTSTALGVTTTINGSRVVVVGGDNGDTSNALSIAGSTPTFTSEIAVPVVLGILDGTLTTAGSTGNKTFTNNNYESTYGFVTGMLVLNAAGSVAWPPVPRSRCRLVVPTAKRRAPGLVPAQDAPIARAPRPSQSRAAMTAQPRGKRSLPVPPQVNPPYPWPNRVPPGRRLIAFVRGRRALGPLGAPDTPVKPTRVPPKIGLRRGRQATIVPAQAVVAPAYPSAKLGAARRLLSVPGHGRRTFPAPAQVPVPPTVPGSRQPAGRRLAALARGRRTLLPLAQDVPSVRPSQPAGRRLAALARGRRTLLPLAQDVPSVRPSRAPSRAGLRRARQPSVVPAQTTPNAPAFAPGKLGAARRLLSVPSRGRRTFPAQPQIPVPAQVPGNRWSSGRSKLAARKPGRPTVPVTQATPAPPAWVPQRTSRRLLAAAVGRARRAGGPVSDASSVLRPRSMPPRPLVPRRRSQVIAAPQSIVPPPVVLGNRQPRGARIAALLRTRKTVPVPAQVPVQPEKLRISAVGSTGLVSPAQRTGVTNPTMSEAEV